MNTIRISRMTSSSVLYLYTEREEYFLNPEYQRQSDIWNIEKRQLLVDSIINGYDIPKFYVHKFSKPMSISGAKYNYAIIDGKQRLESLWSFIDGKYSLGDSVLYLKDPKVRLEGLTYNELGQKYPSLKVKFDSFILDVIVVDTDDVDLIEDMFSRLNEAIPLSSAEKRNAYGGPLPKLIRELVKHKFFTSCLPFANRRYRHYDLAAKFLFISWRNKIVDTKKIYLDSFVKEWVGKQGAKELRTLKETASRVLDRLANTFKSRDPLLKSAGMVTLYYHLFRIAESDPTIAALRRQHFESFENTLALNREVASQDIEDADYDLLEFDRLVQTPNDSYAMEDRLRVFYREVLRAEWPASSPVQPERMISGAG